MFAHEFNSSVALRWALGALAFAYLIVFDQWVGQSTVTRQAVEGLQYICPKYLYHCEAFYLLEKLPNGYSQTIFYMVLFGMLLGVVYAIYRQAWQYAQLLLLIPFLWHAANVFLITEVRNGNYEYYLFIYAFILLILPYKEFFLKLAIVLLYTLSTVAKIHPAWIAGTYFSSLQLGLPLVPDALIPVATNVVIVMEMVGAWFLFSKNPIIQRSVLIFFIFFHIYSGFLVYYRYPATVLPMLIIMFGLFCRYTPVPLDRRSIPGWAFTALLVVFQFIPVLIPGDEKLTLEGNQYGLYMFESNHQCISSARIVYESGAVAAEKWSSENARNRCDPYRDWFTFNKRCDAMPRIERIEWTFDHSVNGGPFLRIVDVANACAVDYSPFSHNSWIYTRENDPEVIGYPVKNRYY